MGPVEAGDAAIGDREIHLDGLTCVVNVTVIDVVRRLMDMAAVHYGVVAMIMIAIQVRM